MGFDPIGDLVEKQELQEESVEEDTVEEEIEPQAQVAAPVKVPFWKNKRFNLSERKPLFGAVNLEEEMNGSQVNEKPVTEEKKVTPRKSTGKVVSGKHKVL
jgi:hypothetical protein